MADAGTVTVIEESLGSMKKILWTWVSSAGGAADLQTTLAYTGAIERAVFIPDSGGTQPTNLYDVTVLDEDSADVLIGLGADLSNTAAVGKAASNGLGAVANDRLYLHVINGGNAKGGKVVLYLR